MHSGGIHPAMPQALEIPGTHGTSLQSGREQKLSWTVQHVARCARSEAPAAPGTRVTRCGPRVVSQQILLSMILIHSLFALLFVQTNLTQEH
jgi:hypothetical protein